MMHFILKFEIYIFRKMYMYIVFVGESYDIHFNGVNHLTRRRRTIDPADVCDFVILLCLIIFSRLPHRYAGPTK